MKRDAGRKLQRPKRGSGIRKSLRKEKMRRLRLLQQKRRKLRKRRSLLERRRRNWKQQ